jgi:hypothetical protein
MSDRGAKKRFWFLATAVALWSAFGGPAPASAQTQTAVEYYYPAWNFYFVTAFPDEIVALDGGAFGGAWKRTGQTFTVWSGPTNGALPTCRFFSTIFDPRSSHFYTPYAAECAQLKQNPGWQYEAIAFYLQLPDTNGTCPAGTVILYRLYNNSMGGAPNHRFITDAATFSQMRDAGWTFEGDGRTGAFACVPASQVIPIAAEGFWDGTTSADASIDGVVLDDGTFYFFYAADDSSSAGLIQGNATAVDGQFASSNAKNFDFLGYGALDVSITGNYVPQTSLDGTTTSARGSVTFAATYEPTYEQPASLSDAAGMYSGATISMYAVYDTVITIGATGAVSGAVQGCAFTGSAAPHGAAYVLDLVVTFLGPCFYASTYTGVVLYDVASGEIIAMAVNGSRTNALLLFGSK